MKVFCAGTFDIITVGHINLLLFCRELAGYKGEVIISLDSDAKITRDKGAGRPIFEWLDRANAIESLKFGNNKIVDKIYMHQSNDYLDDMIRFSIKPDIIVVGSDYQGKRVVGDEYAEVKYFDRDWRFSSTKVIDAIKAKQNDI